MTKLGLAGLGPRLGLAVGSRLGTLSRAWLGARLWARSGGGETWG